MTAEDEFTGCVAVIIPTFNEADNIRPMTTRVRSAVPTADMLIVDDNSPDGTGGSRMSSRPQASASMDCIAVASRVWAPPTSRASRRPSITV
jgi:hypothetical protein